MRSYEGPKGPLPIFATAIFMVGLALSNIVDPALIGIVLMVVGILFGMSLVVAQARRGDR